tara:strand:- start:1159 stop:1359 length:201 start_codon:yes stop_codon:yes gene_type:complete
MKGNAQRVNAGALTLASKERRVFTISACGSVARALTCSYAAMKAIARLASIAVQRTRLAGIAYVQE